MGIQDRDYYREALNKKDKADTYWNKTSGCTAQSHRNSIRNPKRTNLKYLLFPVFAFGLLWYGANELLDNRNNLKPSAIAMVPQWLKTMTQPKSQIPMNLMPGGITLQADRQGHYRGTALINNVAMPFLIDTGATNTVIPEKMATAAGLSFGKVIQTNTAGGPIYDRLTHINSLKIGGVEIRNIEAGINQHLQEVLIGMNTLKYFRMTQDQNTLTLVAYQDSTTKIMANSEVITTPAPHIKESWKKAVLCDELKRCQTSYSQDHS